MKRITLITIILCTGLFAKAPKGDMVQLTEWLYNDLRDIQSQVENTNSEFTTIKKTLDLKVKSLEEHNKSFTEKTTKELNSMSTSQEELSQSTKNSLLRLKQDISYLNQEVGTLQSSIASLKQKIDVVTQSLSKKEKMEKYTPSKYDAELLKYIGE
ncbi:MAG: hypothetical protein ACPGUI_00345 [Halarcobacter sp.]